MKRDQPDLTEIITIISSFFILPIIVTSLLSLLDHRRKIVCALSLLVTNLRSQICTTDAPDTGAPNDRVTPLDILLRLNHPDLLHCIFRSLYKNLCVHYLWQLL